MVLQYDLSEFLIFSPIELHESLMGTKLILLQQALGLPQPTYLHTPLVLASDGTKLSKQNGALAVEVGTPAQALAGLQSAAKVLQLQPSQAATCAQALAEWVTQWRDRWVITA